MEKILEFIRAYLVNVYKMTTPEVDALLNADTFDPTAALTAITEKDRQRVAQFSGKFQEGVNKGKADALKALETQLVTKYGFTPDPENPLQGVELVDAIVAQQANEKAPTDATKLTAEDIRKLPAFQPIQREFTTQLNKVKTESDNKIKEIQRETQEAQIFTNVVSKKALETLTALKPVLPKNAAVAEKQKSSFLNEFKQYTWQDQNGVVIAIEKDGTAAKDAHGNSITLEDFSKSKAAEWFEFEQNNGGGNAGNGRPGEQGNGGGNGGGTDYPAGITKPKTFDEYASIVNNTALPIKDRQTVAKVWEEEQTNGTGK